MIRIEEHPASGEVRVYSRTTVGTWTPIADQDSAPIDIRSDLRRDPWAFGFDGPLAHFARVDAVFRNWRGG